MNLMERLHQWTREELWISSTCTFVRPLKQFPTSLLWSKLERYGSDVWIVWWVRNWFDGCSQRVVVNSTMSRWRSMPSGVHTGISTV